MVETSIKTIGFKSLDALSTYVRAFDKYISERHGFTEAEHMAIADTYDKYGKDILILYYK